MRLLHLPQDLGHPSNALPSRLFGVAEGYTWEDYHDECRHRFPVRYRLDAAVEWLSRWPRVKHALYWLRTHTYNRYHIVDIRKAEPENLNGYRWGWLDRDHVLLLAAFTVLRQFVEQEKPWDCSESIVRAEADGDSNETLPSLRQQKANHAEIMALCRWWTVERFAEYAAWEKARDAAYDAYCANREDEALRSAWMALENSEHVRDDEMLHRLVATRHAMWT